MARHRARWWLLRWCPWVLAAVTLSACSVSTPPSAHSVGDAAFPVHVAAANGAVEIPHQPRRIVSLSPTATESLYAFGAGGQVAAVDAYSTYPAQAPRTDLTETAPNVEAIAKYRPDLVVIAEDTNQVVAQLRKLAVPVLVEPPASDLSAAYREIDQLGLATGHAADAALVVSRIRGEIAAIVHSTPPSKKPLRVYHELEPTFYSATSHTFIGQIYSLFGLQNIADAAHLSGPYPQLSDEYIIAANPDLIVLADTVCCRQSTATVEARSGWRDIAAVKSGAVVPVDDSVASQWGPRIVVFARTIAAAVRRLEQRERSR